MLFIFKNKFNYNFRVVNKRFCFPYCDVGNAFLHLLCWSNADVVNTLTKVKLESELFQIQGNSQHNRGYENASCIIQHAKSKTLRTKSLWALLGEINMIDGAVKYACIFNGKFTSKCNQTGSVHFFLRIRIGNQRILGFFFFLDPHLDFRTNSTTSDF